MALGEIPSGSASAFRTAWSISDKAACVTKLFRPTLVRSSTIAFCVKRAQPCFHTRRAVPCSGQVGKRLCMHKLYTAYRWQPLYIHTYIRTLLHEATFYNVYISPCYFIVYMYSSLSINIHICYMYVCSSVLYVFDISIVAHRGWMPLSINARTTGMAAGHLTAMARTTATKKSMNSILFSPRGRKPYWGDYIQWYLEKQNDRNPRKEFERTEHHS